MANQDSSNQRNWVTPQTPSTGQQAQQSQLSQGSDGMRRQPEQGLWIPNVGYVSAAGTSQTPYYDNASAYSVPPPAYPGSGLQNTGFMGSQQGIFFQNQMTSFPPQGQGFDDSVGSQANLQDLNSQAYYYPQANYQGSGHQTYNYPPQNHSGYNVTPSVPTPLSHYPSLSPYKPNSASCTGQPAAWPHFTNHPQLSASSQSNFMTSSPITSQFSLSAQPYNLNNANCSGPTTAWSHFQDQYLSSSQPIISSQPVMPPITESVATPPISVTPNVRESQTRDPSVSSVRSQRTDVPQQVQSLSQGTAEASRVSTPKTTESLPAPQNRSQNRPQNQGQKNWQKRNFNRVFNNSKYASIVIENEFPPRIVREGEGKSAFKNQRKAAPSNRSQYSVAPAQTQTLPASRNVIESRVVTTCNKCYMPNHNGKDCKAGASKEIFCDGCGMINHLRSNCRWVQISAQLQSQSQAKNKSSVQTPQTADFGTSGGGTKRKHSQADAGRSKASSSKLSSSRGFESGKINPKRVLPISRDFVKIGNVSNLKSPCTYTICMTNWDTAWGILTDPKPTPKMRRERDHPPLFVLFGDGFSNQPMLATNLHRAQKVVVNSIVRIGERSGLAIVERFIDDGIAMFGICPKPSHLAIDFVPDPEISSYVIQNQVGFVSQRARVYSVRERGFRCAIASLNLGRETFVGENQISHEFSNIGELRDKEPLWIDMFQVTREQFEKLGILTIPKGIFEEGRLLAYPPCCLVKAIKPMAKVDRDYMMRIGKFDMVCSRDLEKAKADFRRVKECHGASIAFCKLYKHRAQEQCVIPIKLGGDPFEEHHVTTFINKEMNEDLSKRSFVERARLEQLKTGCPVIIEAAYWDKPEKKEKGKVKITMRDEYGKPDEEENFAGLTREQAEERKRKRDDERRKSRRFVYSGKTIGFSTTEAGQPANLDIARDMYVTVLSGGDARDQSERNQREIRRLMESRALEQLNVDPEDREVVKRSPRFMELVNQFVDNRLKTLRVRYQTEPTKIPEADELDVTEIKYAEGDEPRETDDRFFELNNLYGKDLELFLKGNSWRTGYENAINGSIEWDICWNGTSFCLLTVLIFLGYEPDQEELDEVIEWRRKYKELKRLLRYVDTTQTPVSDTIIKAEACIENYSAAVDPFERARLQKEMEAIPASVVTDLEADKFLMTPGPSTPRETHSFFSERTPVYGDIRDTIHSASDFDIPIDNEIDRSDSSYAVKTDCNETNPETKEVQKLVKVFNGRKSVLRPKITDAMICKKIEDDPTMNEEQKLVLYQLFRDGLTGAVCQAAAGTGKTYTLAEFMVYVRYKYIKFLALCVANNNEASANIAASLYKAWNRIAPEERKPFEILLLRSNQAEEAEKIAERPMA